LSDCEEIRPRLAAFLDGEIEDAGHIKDHLNSCPECSRLLGEHERVSRLVSLLPDPSPHPEAWSSVEPRLSSFWRPRSYALVPAAAIALVAIGLYLFYFSGDVRRPVGTLARLIGNAELKTLSVGNWVGIPEKGVARIGDTVRTDSQASARMDLTSGGHLFLDRNTEIRFLQEDTPTLRVQLLSGRTCLCNCSNFCLEVAGMEMTGSDCFYVVDLEAGTPVIYVKTGELNWVKGRERIKGRVKPMHMINLSDGVPPAPIESAEVFEWAELLSETTEPAVR
jgi:hypothetical protein